MVFDVSAGIAFRFERSYFQHDPKREVAMVELKVKPLGNFRLSNFNILFHLF